GLLLNSARSFYLRSAHEDEQTFLIILSRMRPRRLQLNPHLFTYGGAYVYSLGAWLALCAALRVAALHASMAPYLADPSLMASLYFSGRLFTVAAYLGCALLLLRIGRRHLGERAGLLAALFFLFAPIVVVQAHVMKNHMLWAFLFLWTLDLSLDALAAGGLAAYAAAGAVSGLTVGAFLAAWPACLVVGAACALRIFALRKPAAAELKGLAAAAAASAAAFFASNPYWLLDWRSARAEMKVLSGWGTFDLSHPFLFLGHSFVHAVTWPLFALIAAGAAWAAAKGRREPALWLCLFAFLSGLAMMTTVGDVTVVRQARYFLGFLAVGQLLAGRAAADLLRWKGGRPWIAGALALLLAYLASAGAAYAYNFHEDSGARSTHVESGEWIEAHVPAGASIGLLRLPQPSNAPYFRYDRYDLRFIESAGLFATLPASQLPEYVAVTSPDYDDRPAMEPALSRYELAAEFDRSSLFPWFRIDPTATTADPEIDIYRLKRAP
ncbi:MAG TPA: hypothetical protein VH309_15445, partial [Elusimicrobiota bacterium]|nr:hypothetical protein [Elusimicrobiota bacterium]